LRCNFSIQMGCNAWNHPSDCDCGWGGDTGGRPGALPSGVRRLQLVDGHTWRIDRRPTYDAFLNPNAVCPVCGEPVYFYRSQFGGRVFFDELGWPWPKHPCTDNSTSLIVGPVPSTLRFKPNATWPGRFKPNAWRPLAPMAISPSGEYDLLTLSESDHLPRNCLFVPAGWIGDAPSFWRWSDKDPTMIEISCVRVDANGEVRPQTFAIPSWIANSEEHEQWIEKPHLEPSPERLNEIGYALSFAWRMDGLDNWREFISAVDFTLARALFERGAGKGNWAAINNLGVIYEQGLGVSVDKERAFDLYYRAAQSLHKVPMAHLARCYREGIGCTQNLSNAEFLQELITSASDPPL
jgi:hypothetical protein